MNTQSDTELQVWMNKLLDTLVVVGTGEWFFGKGRIINSLLAEIGRITDAVIERNKD